MEIGDVYSVEMPSSDGHEQAGPRPAIIVQTFRFEAQLPTVLVVPLTSQLAAQALPGTCLIQPDRENGLTLPSVALVFQLRAIDKMRLKYVMGRLNPTDLAMVRRQVEALLQLP